MSSADVKTENEQSLEISPMQTTYKPRVDGRARAAASTLAIHAMIATECRRLAGNLLKLAAYYRAQSQVRVGRRPQLRCAFAICKRLPDKECRQVSPISGAPGWAAEPPFTRIP
jgi:hypothetical protein